jgi:glycerol kinase
MQRLSDIVGLTVQRSSSSEVTALGAAWLAGHGVGCWPGPEQFAAEREIGQGFHPSVGADQNFQLVRGWKAAVRATIQFASQVA